MYTSIVSQCRAPTQQQRALIVTLDYQNVIDHPKKLGRVRVRTIHNL